MPAIFKSNSIIVVLAWIGNRFKMDSASLIKTSLGDTEFAIAELLKNNGLSLRFETHLGEVMYFIHDNVSTESNFKSIW